MPTAVPHIFPLLPKYLSSNSSAPQPTTSSTSSAVLINENSQINKHVSYYLKEKNFSGVQRNVKNLNLYQAVLCMWKKVAAFFTIISKVLTSHWIYRNFLVQLLLPTSLKCKCLFLLLYYQDLLTILNCIQPAL